MPVGPMPPYFRVGKPQPVCPAVLCLPGMSKNARTQIVIRGSTVLPCRKKSTIGPAKAPLEAVPPRMASRTSAYAFRTSA